MTPSEHLSTTIASLNAVLRAVADAEPHTGLDAATFAKAEKRLVP